MKTHGRESTVCATMQVEIIDAQLGCFISSCSRVVHKKQQGAIPIAKYSGWGGSIKQSIDLRLFEIADWHGGRTLGLDGAELSTPVKIFGASFCDEAGERMDGRQTLIATGDAAFPLFFDVLQEGAQQVRIDVRDEQLVHFFMCLGSNEHHQQAHGIAIALLWLAGQIPLPDEVFQQE